MIQIIRIDRGMAINIHKMYQFVLTVQDIISITLLFPSCLDMITQLHNTLGITAVYNLLQTYAATTLPFVRFEDI